MIKLITVLFKKHKKHLPKAICNTAFGELLCYGFSIFVSAWTLQGILYMDKREALLKILLDIGVTTVLLLAGFPGLASFLIAHSINFAFNGQWFAMYTHMGATNVTPVKFLKYIVDMQKRMEKCSFIEDAVAFGSLSRGIYKTTSDMDIRVCPKHGTVNWVKTIIWGIVERARAFVYGFPLDMYIFDLVTVTRKMRTDEPPIVFVNHSNLLEVAYKNTISFNDFTTIFSKKNCK